MLLLLFICCVCVGGQLVNFRDNCRLEQDPSVEFRCIGMDAIEGTRACEASEPPGTVVIPRCRRPHYYAAQPLSNMRCFSGYWDHVARCSPECGRVTSDGISLVVGGRRAKRAELPWHAGIYRKTTQPYMQICGGSLISNNVVLSAAHCFWRDLEEQLPASQFAVAVGKLYLPWNDPNDEAQKSDVKMIHLPPRFQGAMADFQDDIAVVVTAKAFQFKNHIRPVCLSFEYLFEKQQLKLGNNGKVAGWGLTAADGNHSAVLQVVDLPYVEVGTCIINSPPDFRAFITSDKICAGTLNSNSALCMGDSGGGLAFSALVSGVERYFLRGVASATASSTSEHACNVNTYTAFTSILKHEQFIKEFWIETGQFRCLDGSFITAANHCDGTKECPDGSDESVWACAGKRCSKYLFRCNYGACVDKGARCNGVLDCADGSDEVSELCAELRTNPASIVPSANKTLNSNFGDSAPKPDFAQGRRVSLRDLGSACEHRGVSGTCQKAQFCPTYAVLAKHQIENEVTECSRDGTEVVICCTDCQIEDASNAAVTPDGILWKTGGKRKIYDKCVEYAATLPYRCKEGKKVTPRKVFDEEKQCHRLDVSVEAEASPAKKRVDFPSLALLGLTPNATRQPDWYCQAFIISERFLLTTRHCGSAFNAIGVGPMTSVTVGVDQRGPPRKKGDEAKLQPLATSPIYKVKSVTLHPESKSSRKFIDLALLETDTEIKFSEDVLPMCLSEQAAIPDTVQAYVFGMQGRDHNQKVQLELLNETECSDYIHPPRYFEDGINSKQIICYKAFMLAMDTCQGSDGRPIFIPGSVPCAGAAVGVTSLRRSCWLNLPALHTRLYDYLPWIQSVVWP